VAHPDSCNLKRFLCLVPHHWKSSWPSSDEHMQVYDRDGRELGEFKRGDMYLRDLKNTKGHVSGCTNGQWHPTDRFTAMTSSSDGTIRIWDCEAIDQKMVIRPTGATGRIPISACCYNADGTLLAGALFLLSKAATNSGENLKAAPI
jgi:WD40 repeat protein